MAEKIKFYTAYNHNSADINKGQTFNKTIDDYKLETDPIKGHTLVKHGERPVYDTVQKAKQLVMSVTDILAADALGQTTVLNQKKGVTYADIRGLDEIDNPIREVAKRGKNTLNNIVFNDINTKPKDGEKETKKVLPVDKTKTEKKGVENE